MISPQLYQNMKLRPTPTFYYRPPPCSLILGFFDFITDVSGFYHVFKSSYVIFDVFELVRKNANL